MAVWDHEEIFKFIDAYHSEETIWNPKVEAYKERALVREAWIRVSDTMGIPVAELKRKREALMATFRQHMKRKKASIATANSEDDIYQPKWVFYDALEAFLADVYDCPRQEKTINIKEFSIVEDGSEEPEAEWDSVTIQPETTEATSDHSNQKSHNSNRKSHQLDQKSHHQPSHHQPSRHKPSHYQPSYHQPSHHQPSHHQPSYRPDLQKLRELSQHSELQETYKHMKFACNILSSEVSRPRDEEDECDLFGKVVAKKLKKTAEDDRQEIMLRIDTLLLNRERAAQDQYHFT